MTPVELQPAATFLLLLPLLILLPGWAFLAGGQRSSPGPGAAPAGLRISIVDIIFVSITLSGWAAQTLALTGRFTLPAIIVSITGLSLAAVLLTGTRDGLRVMRIVALEATKPSWTGLAVALTVVLLAFLLYLPPVTTSLAEDPVPAANFALGSHLARTAALPASPSGPSQAGAASAAMRSGAGPGFFFPAWIGLLQLTVGFGWSGAASAIFTTLSLAVVFLLGRQVTGSALFGAALLLALGLNYPQAWLARVSAAESAAQFLVLVSALFFSRASDNSRLVPAAAVSLGAALLCAADLPRYAIPTLLLLLALHAAGPAESRRRAALFTLWTLPFLAQAGLQSLLAGQQPDSPLHLAIGAGVITTAALISLRPPGFAARRPRRLVLICGGLFVIQWLASWIFFRAAVPRIAGGSAHWMIWYVTLPFIVLLAGGLLELLAAPKMTLALVRAAGPLIPLALVSLPFLFHNPGGPGDQPPAARPFTVAVIPVTLMLGLLFFHRMAGRLRQPALRLIWIAFLPLLLGLNLANLMPMATGHPGFDAGPLVQQVAEPLVAGGPPFSAVVEPELGARGLHVGLEGAYGIPSWALSGNGTGRRQFNDLVRKNAAAGRRTALVVVQGAFTPDPSTTILRPLADHRSSLRLLPPARDHLPSSVTNRAVRLQVYEALPAGTGNPPPALTTIRFGVYEEDWPYLDHGVRGITRAAGRTFRWTGPRARLRLPSWTAGVTLEVGGFRPPGAPDAHLSAGYPGEGPPLSRNLPRTGFVSIFIPRPFTTGNGSSPVYLELTCSCFHPGPWFTGTDASLLGIQLSSLIIHPPGPSFEITSDSQKSASTY